MIKNRIAEKIAEYRRQKDWNFFFTSIDGHEQQEAFLEVYEEMSPRDYWKYLGEIIQEESIYNDELKKLLTNENKDLSLRGLLMSDKDKEIYHTLPPNLLIYRGANESAPDQGWSWSLSEKIAHFFANRFHKGVVIKGECERKDVIAYFGVRNEQEILIPFNKVKNIRVLKRIENTDIQSTDNIFFKKNLHKSGISNYAAYKLLRIDAKQI
jgi:hypothetical protein